MSEERVRTILAEAKAVITDDHFVYSAGEHGSAYVNKDAVYPYVQVVAELGGDIAQLFYNNGIEYDVVAVPEKGAIILGTWVTYGSACRVKGTQVQKILSVYAEKDGDKFVFKRGYDEIVRGKRVLIVEDLINSGETVARMVRAVLALKGTVVGGGAICNRGGVTAEMLDVPVLFSLLNLPLKKWPEKECPLCAAGVPINTQYGHGKAYLERKAAEAAAEHPYSPWLR